VCLPQTFFEKAYAHHMLYAAPCCATVRISAADCLCTVWLRYTPSPSGPDLGRFFVPVLGIMYWS